MNEMTAPWRLFIKHLESIISHTDLTEQRLLGEITFLSSKIPGPLMVTQDGKVQYSPVYAREWRNRTDRNQPLPKERKTSFIRFLRWLSQWEPQFKDLARFQKFQDELIKWSAQTFDTTRFSFEIVSGRDIIAAYKDGPPSCMAGKTGQLRLYVSNPEKVSLVKIYDQGEYKGRAILWLLDDNRQFLDRIYPGNDIMAAWMRSVAKELGWVHKMQDSVGGDTTSEHALLVTLKHPSNRRIPYLDTLFKLFNVDTNTITLTDSNIKQDGNVYYLEDVGDYEGTCELYLGSHYKFHDGTPVPKKYDRLPNQEFYIRSQHWEPMAWIYIRRGQRWVKRYMKPGDRGYVLHGTPRYLVNVVEGDDGKLYFRGDVRKARGKEQYTALPGSKPVVITKVETFDEGQQIMWVTPQEGA